MEEDCDLRTSLRCRGWVSFSFSCYVQDNCIVYGVMNPAIYTMGRIVRMEEIYSIERTLKDAVGGNHRDIRILRQIAQKASPA